jgi:predicted O-methyltransferase YrrM
MQLQQVQQSSLNGYMHPVKLDDMPMRYMNPGELEVLCALMRMVRPRRVIEFGVNLGRTAKVLLREVKSITQYVGVDVMPGYNPECKVQRREIPNHPGQIAEDDHRFSLLLRRRGTLDLKPDDLRYADAVFIDGDHSYKVVMHDTILATKILAPGGIIVWHDYHNQPTVQVKQALEELQDMGRKIMHVDGTWIAYERR